MARFKQQFKVKASLQATWQFHDDPVALYDLTPPPLKVKILHKDDPLSVGSTLSFRLALFGIQPLGATWKAIYDEFNPYREPTKQCGFIDRSLSSPFHHWVHRHRFIPNGDGTTTCVDDVTFHLTPLRGLLGDLVDYLIAYPSLILLFGFRQFQTRRILAARSKQAHQSPA
ncbi:MAG: hypothetical protein OHK0023_02800 [Anaerolineae bacterium]